MPLTMPFGVLAKQDSGFPYYWLPNYGTGYASHNTTADGATYFSSYGSFLKLDETGKLLFGKSVPGGRGIHQDPSGNVYVTQGADGGTVKFDSSGNVVWAKELFSPNDYSSEDSAIDSNGNVYVCLDNGTSSGILKLGSNGTPEWLRTSSSLSGTFAISVSPDNSYVAMSGTPDADSAVISVFRTSDLQVQWERRFDVSGASLHIFGDLDWDSNNNVYAVGWYRNPSASIYAVKLDIGGNLQWKKGAVAKPFPYGLPGIAVDGNDNVYVSEYTGGLAKFDASGNVLFGRSFEAPSFLRMSASKVDDTISIMGFSGLKLKGDGSGLGTYTSSDGSKTLVYSSSSVDTSESVSYGGSFSGGWPDTGFSITNSTDSISDITAQPEIVYLEGA